MTRASRRFLVGPELRRLRTHREFVHHVATSSAAAEERLDEDRTVHELLRRSREHHADHHRGTQVQSEDPGSAALARCSLSKTVDPVVGRSLEECTPRATASLRVGARLAVGIRRGLRTEGESMRTSTHAASILRSLPESFPACATPASFSRGKNSNTASIRARHVVDVGGRMLSAISRFSFTDNGERHRRSGT